MPELIFLSAISGQFLSVLIHSSEERTFKSGGFSLHSDPVKSNIAFNYFKRVEVGGDGGQARLSLGVLPHSFGYLFCSTIFHSRRHRLPPLKASSLANSDG